MKDWEIEKVNELYRQIDQLQQHNDQLSRSGKCDDLTQVIEAIDKLGKQLAENSCKCQCDCGSTTTKRNTSKRAK